MLEPTQSPNTVCTTVCLALQPIIYYFALATGADPIPFLTAEFTAANIWSMLLFVGECAQAAAGLRPPSNSTPTCAALLPVNCLGS
jgi:Na+/H+ antiporter NhaD/arsenite permease-like protein